METIKKWKQGDQRGDGYRFLGYKHNLIRKDGTPGEQWANEESFHRFKVKQALGQARLRSKQAGMPFDLDIDFLLQIFPKDNKCPILGIELEWNADSRAYAPSLDRIDPKKGYVKSNVAWLSLRANRMKDNSSVDDLKAIISYIEQFERNKLKEVA